MSNPTVFMDIQVGNKSPERVVFEVWSHVVPRTAANFVALCTGASRAQLTFKGSKFHRVIPGFMVQGGDITAGDGTGGESIYGRHFKDEQAGLQLKHDRAGLLSMANAGPDSNGSQFFVTLDEARHLDGKHVVFGRVLSGFQVFEAIAKVPTNASDKPKKACVIVDCGVIKVVSADDAKKKEADEAAKAKAKAAEEEQQRLTNLETVRAQSEEAANAVAATVRQALQNKATKTVDDGAAKSGPLKHMFDALTDDDTVTDRGAKKAKKRSVFGDDDEEDEFQ
jgi:cyclophilin family peptidyl-prolyl cis-trans isomerase